LGRANGQIEASGKLAGFFAVDMAGSEGGPGLTRTARQYSASYQNFLSLLQLYQNNGGVWLQDFFDARKDPEAKNLSALGSIYIYYDNTLYIGSFDTLSVTEADTDPHSLEYSFSFSVRSSFLLDRELENSSQNYGMGDLFPKAFPTAIATTSSTQGSGDPALDEVNRAHAASLASDAAADQQAADAAAADAVRSANASENQAALDSLFTPPEPNRGNNAVTPGKGSKSKSVRN
jgi:hypothetical protein